MRITFVKVEVQTLTPLSVTSPETSMATGQNGDSETLRKELDMPVHRKADGSPTIPATTIAGGLRAHLQPHLRNSLMGTTESEAVASPLHVWDAIVVPPAGERVTVVRQRTAIDRHRGAPASSRLFDTESLAAGSRVTLLFEFMGSGELLNQLLRAITSWNPRFGRGITTGSGSVQVNSITHTTLDLDNNEDLLRYLALSGPSAIVRLLNDEGSRLTPAGAPAAWLVDAGFRIVDALHVGSGLSQGNLLLMERDSQNRPVLPGSAIKGVLRSRCEFILRSLDVPACLDGSCGECPTCQLFGYSLPKPDSYGRTGRRGILVFHDSLVEVETETQRAHVAIDRVTGGSRDSALYSTECIDQGSLRIRVEALETPPPWTVGLLAAALRDVSDGYVGFGGATTRGYGSLRRTDASEVAESQMFSDLQEIRDSFSKAGS